MSEVFQIVPAPARWMFILGGIAIGIPFVVLFSLFLHDGPKVTDLLGMIILVGCIFVIPVILFIVFRSAKAARFEISSEGLRLRGDFYGRLIPFSALEVNQGKIFDLTVETEYKPSWKTCGSSFPGYQSGWFRLKNKEKALLYLTDRKKVVHLPTKKGYCLLLSPENPERFLEVLRRYHP